MPGKKLVEWRLQAQLQSLSAHGTSSSRASSVTHGVDLRPVFADPSPRAAGPLRCGRLPATAPCQFSHERRGRPWCCGGRSAGPTIGRRARRPLPGSRSLTRPQAPHRDLLRLWAPQGLAPWPVL